jgi:hypothetical protein
MSAHVSWPAADAPASVTFHPDTNGGEQRPPNSGNPAVDGQQQSDGGMAAHRDKRLQ